MIHRYYEPAVSATRTEYQRLLYFRGLTGGVQLETGVDAALTQGHQVILTLDQLPYFRAGCGVHLRKTDRVSDALAHPLEMSQRALANYGRNPR